MCRLTAKTAATGQWGGTASFKSVTVFHCFFFFNVFIIDLFREREEGREKGREKGRERNINPFPLKHPRLGSWPST